MLSLASLLSLMHRSIAKQLHAIEHNPPLRTAQEWRRPLHQLGLIAGGISARPDC
jgi:hypothetical protein